jgi:hypothetical protein
MKHYFLLTLMLIFPLTAFKKNQCYDSTYLISDNHFDIQCLATGTGHAGKVAIITIKNNTGSPQTFSMPPGSMMKNLDTNYQDLMILKPIVRHLNPYQTLSFPVDAYCCKLRGKSPVSKNKFIFMNQTPNILLKNFAVFFNQFNDSVSHSDIQTMIWCLSDNQNPAGIPVNSENLFKYKKWICEAKNIPIPWYIIKQKKFILNDGRIVILNDSLIADFEAISNKTGYETFFITDEKGNELFFAQTNPVTNGKNKIELRLKITHWPKGTYYLTAKDEKNTPLKKQIDV